MIICIKNSDFCKEYIEKYGRHFNEKLCNYAISLMNHNKNSLSKELIDTLMKTYSINLNRLFDWDYVFVANMAYNDFYQSSLSDEKHLVLYVKDYIDDKDGYDELPFSRWIADVKHKPIEVNWEDMI